MCTTISSLHRWFICIHLSYPYLTTLSSLFLFLFNTGLLLNKHREVVYSLCLHSDCGRPTTIFYTTFLYRHIYRYSIHGTPCAGGYTIANLRKYMIEMCCRALRQCFSFFYFGILKMLFRILKEALFGKTFYSKLLILL